MDQRLCIVTLGVSDLETARRFYLDGLGWREVPGEDTGSICFIQMPGMVLGLYPRAGLYEDLGVEPPAGPPPGPGERDATYAYNTASREETDRVLETAVAAGATLIKAAQEVFWGGYSGYFADPDGHQWEVAHNPYTLPGPDGSFRMEPPAEQT